MLIVDGHEDLAYNALVDGRDYLQSAHTTRAVEEGGPVPEGNGLCMLGLPEWLKGGVGVVIATVTAIPRDGAKAGELTYANPEGAYQQGIAQLNIYRRWEAMNNQISVVTDRGGLDAVVGSWSDAADEEARQVGLVLLIENADLIREPEEVDFWYEQGVRLIGPAWNANRYTGNTQNPGPLTDLGRRLLKGMARRGMILDLSHMPDEACAEALVTYDGPIVATHANPRRLVPYPRMIPDDVIEGIVARDGVVGIMPANWALDLEWFESKRGRDIHADAVVSAIDAVCQLAGDTRHVGIGSDFDGGFGAEVTPVELDTVADLPVIAGALTERGYGDESVAAIMGGNWLRVLRRQLSPGSGR